MTSIINPDHHDGVSHSLQEFIASIEQELDQQTMELSKWMQVLDTSADKNQKYAKGHHSERPKAGPLPTPRDTGCSCQADDEDVRLSIAEGQAKGIECDGKKHNRVIQNTNISYLNGALKKTKTKKEDGR